MPNDNQIRDYFRNAWKQLREETEDRSDALGYFEELCTDCVIDTAADSDKASLILQQMLDSGELD